jgi:uncharacterized protein YceH (UPF0502 family)
MNREIQLDPIEARVFSVLVEKALTTPEQYPLTLNALTNGANQKSNRDPVLSLDEVEVEAALQRLEKKYMVRTVFPMNSRVEKYLHNGKDALGLDASPLATVAELLLRGPQTPGELRTHVGRMVPIESLDQLSAVLANLIDRGLVQRLAPVPGSRAERYVQLLSPDLHPLDAPAPAASSAPAVPVVTPVAELAARVAALEAEVARLSEQLQSLAATVGGVNSPQLDPLSGGEGT